MSRATSGHDAVVTAGTECPASVVYRPHGLALKGDNSMCRTTATIGWIVLSPMTIASSRRGLAVLLGALCLVVSSATDSLAGVPEIRGRSGQSGTAAGRGGSRHLVLQVRGGT